MPVRLGRFEMPKRLFKDEATATPTYAKFVAEAFETGYGYTLGNALRRVLLSSLEGAAITNVKISGAMHEFTTVDGVVEDVTEIVLNLKKVLFKAHTREPQTLYLSVDKDGPVTAADIQTNQNVECVNPEQLIYSLFSPITRVRYQVESARVGQRTDYDRLVLEIWTDGRITPDDALVQGAAILRHHFDVFVDYDRSVIEFEQEVAKNDDQRAQLKKLLSMSVNEIELSVRAANCLNNANITTVGQLAMKSEQEMLKYRNFGKKSLNEIKDKLTSLGLSLGMKFESDLVENIKEDKSN